MSSQTGGMIRILEYLIRHCPFLLTSPAYRFVDSRVGESFGGDAYLVFESNSLRMRFVCDRGQLFLDFQSTSHPDDTDWFSVDVVRRLLEGAHSVSAELDAASAAFLEANLVEIEACFAERSDETVAELRRLERVRAKELFG